MIGSRCGMVLVAALVATGCDPVSQQPRGDAGPGGTGDGRRDAAIDGAPDGAPDAATDGAIDAPPATPPGPLPDFDIAYINEFRYPFNVTYVSGFAVIVNMGPKPLSLSKIEVKEVRDDNPDVTVLFELTTPSNVNLGTGLGAGLLSQFAAAMLYGRGLLVEDVVDDQAPAFQLSFATPPFPPPNITVNVSVKLQIGEGVITLPFKVNTTPDGDVDTLNADRLPHRPQ